MSKRINVNPDHYKGAARSARSEGVVDAARRSESASKRAEMRRWLAQRSRERGFKPLPPSPRQAVRPSVDPAPAPSRPEVASAESLEDTGARGKAGRSTRTKRSAEHEKPGRPRAAAGRTGQRKKVGKKKARTRASKRATKKSGGKEELRPPRTRRKKLGKKKK